MRERKVSEAMNLPIDIVVCRVDREWCCSCPGCSVFKYVEFTVVNIKLA